MIGRLSASVMTLCCLVLFQGMHFADISVTANVSASEVAIDKAIDYTLTINGSRTLVNLDAELFADFYVLGKSTRQGYVQRNNAFESTLTQIVTLRPKQIGKAIIPSFELKIDEQSFETNPFVITVTGVSEKTVAAQPSTSTANQSSQEAAKPLSAVDQALEKQAKKQAEIFVQAYTDKSEAYKGEVVRYQLLLFKLVPFIKDYNYELPDFSDYSVEPLQVDSKAYSKVINNRRYYVQEIALYALIAHKTGDLVIEPTAVNVQLGAFYRPQRLETSPIPLSVKELPLEGRPENFSGLVGDYSLNTIFDDAAAIQNKPLSLKLKLSGYGDLKQVNHFNVDETDDYKIYKSSTKDQIAYTDTIQGIREFEYIIVPKQEGEIDFPSFSLPFFSASEKRYYELVSPTKTISVVSSQQPTNLNMSNETLAEIAKDLRYIRAEVNLKKKEVLFFQSLFGKFWILILLATLSFYVALLLLDRGLDKVLSRVLQLKADKRALKALSKVSGLATQSEKVMAMQTLVYDYLSAIVKMPANSLTSESVLLALKKRDVPDKDIEYTKALLDVLAFMAYSPDAQSKEEAASLLTRCEQVINRLKEYA